MNQTILERLLEEYNDMKEGKTLLFLWEKLYEIRMTAIGQNDWQTLEAFARWGLVKEFRTIKEDG